MKLVKDFTAETQSFRRVPLRKDKNSAKLRVFSLRLCGEKTITGKLKYLVKILTRLILPLKYVTTERQHSSILIMRV
jgi:hypothetical protein